MKKNSTSFFNTAPKTLAVAAFAMAVQACGGPAFTAGGGEDPTPRNDAGAAGMTTAAGGRPSSNTGGAPAGGGGAGGAASGGSSNNAAGMTNNGGGAGAAPGAIVDSNPGSTYEIDCYAGQDQYGDIYKPYACVVADSYTIENDVNVLKLKGEVVSNDTRYSRCDVYKPSPSDVCWMKTSLY